jgi:hypothetical protein
MALFRLFLLGCLFAITGYTAVTMVNHGADLVPVFFGDIAEMAWPGQFNLDFSCFLLLSGMWVAWRHQFAAIGLLLAPVAIFGGMMFLSVYLLVISYTTGGDIRAILLGTERARQR